MLKRNIPGVWGHELEAELQLRVQFVARVP
jgi:hypothetical protein